jgi:hypothetical protein
MTNASGEFRATKLSPCTTPDSAAAQRATVTITARSADGAAVTAEAKLAAAHGPASRADARRLPLHSCSPLAVPTAIFACPIFSPAATQMIDAAASLPGVRLAVVAQEPLAALPPRLAERLAGHWQVRDVTDAAQLGDAVAGLTAHLGAIDRLFGAFEQLQVPLAETRARFGIPGMRPDAAHRFRDKALMKETLRTAGVPVARTSSCSVPTRRGPSWPRSGFRSWPSRRPAPARATRSASSTPRRSNTGSPSSRRTPTVRCCSRSS